MTMFVVLGEGEMPAADLKATLDDLENQAVQDQATFWVTVRATAEPTATDRALMAWVHAHETYYETVGPEANSADDLYKGTQEKHNVKGVAAKVVQLMQEKPEEGEEAIMLALFASDDPDAAEDAELYRVVEQVLEAGFKVLALNDGLAEIGLTGEGEGEEAEPEPEPEKAAAPVKKAAAKAAAPSDDDAWATRENLEGLGIEEIKVIAARFGITLPPRTRQQTYISAILDRNEPEPTPPEVEVEGEDLGTWMAEEAERPTNGQSHDPLDLVRSVLRSLGEALISISR